MSSTSYDSLSFTFFLRYVVPRYVRSGRILQLEKPETETGTETEKSCNHRRTFDILLLRETSGYVVPIPRNTPFEKPAASVSQVPFPLCEEKYDCVTRVAK